MATISGTSGNDSLNGTSGSDTLNGLGGNDTLAGSAGTDFYDGGTGSDTLDLRSTAAGITVNFVDRAISGGFTGTFANIERVLGGDGADNLIGAAGNQTLSSRGGNDTLAGAAGNDTLWGGGGADRFVFRETGTANADSLADFASGSDKIVLDTVVMGTLGASGNFAAGDERFVANSSGTAQEADDRVIYETDTRQIWFDPDGTGVAPRELIGTLQSGATLVATDIVVQGQGGGGPAPIVGTEGNDTLTGTDGNDTIDGRGGNDFLDGGLGADELIGGEGNDTLDASSFFERNDAPDTLIGGLGDDRYNVDNPADVTSDAGGIDTVHVFELSWALADGIENLIVEGDLTVTGIGNDLDNFMKLSRGGRLEGRGGDDTLVSSDIGGELFGEDGNDSLVGDFKSDTLDGGAGDDTFRGATSNDTLSGGAGADVFILDDRSHWDDGFSNPSFDTILDFATGVDDIVLDARVMRELGASGTLTPDDPRFYAAAGATEGHDADDRLVYDTATGRLYYDEDGLGTVDAEVIFVLNAGAGAAALAPTDITVTNGTGGTPRETIVGGSGNDTLVGTEANDYIDGRGGEDSIDALAGNDIAVGGPGQDTLRGGAGDDALLGDEGSDLLAGAEGTDRLTGGGGADQFVIDDLTDWWSDDAITDFAPGSDELLLDLGVMPALGSAGAFAPGDARFHSAPDVRDGADPDDRIVYNTTTGEVYYDRDGSGSFSSRLIVTLQGAPSLTATDLVVIGMAPQPSEGDDELFGTPSSDTIDGLGGADTIDGMSGNDLLFGSAGDDLLFGSDGADQLDGGIGNDRLDGGEGNDTLIGGSGADQLFAGAGDDLLDDRSGDTEGRGNFAGGAGNDTIFGGAANDWIQFGNDYGQDALDGGAGSDRITFFWSTTPSAGVRANLELGTLSGGGVGSATVTNVEEIYGTTLDDDLIGNAGANLLSGSPWSPSSFDGNDRLDGRAGNDVLIGGTGADRYAFTVSPGLANADEIVGFSTSSGDWIVLDGTVHSNSGPSGRFATGDQRFAANSTGSAQDSSDRVIYNTATGQLWYDADGSGAGSAQLIATLQGAPTLNVNSIEVVNGSTAPPPSGNVINGTSGNDSLAGTAGNDTLNGLGGNDTLIGSGGNDFYDGGTGSDTLDLKATSAGVTVSFASGTISGGFSGTFANMERVLGSDGADSLSGAAGNQTLSARGGNDTLAGGAGNDTLWGGGSADAFVFREMGAAHADRISDFASGSDKVQLDDAAFTAIGAMGNFATGDARFKANGTGTATETDDRVVFNSSTGQLYYDADGSGAGTAQLIATVQSGSSVAATDIVVI